MSEVVTHSLTHSYLLTHSLTISTITITSCLTKKQKKKSILDHVVRGGSAVRKRNPRPRLSLKLREKETIRNPNLRQK
jgi:hypothetical protein